MFRIGSVECTEWKQICDKEGITTYPSYKVYPPMPIPPSQIDMEGKEVDTDKLKKAAYKYIGNRVIDISSQNIDTFLKDNPGKPKMLLFANNTSTPIVYRALSTYFDVSNNSVLNLQKTLEFGIIKQEDEALVKKYKVTKFPTLFLLKNTDKPIKYDGESFSYHDLFNFINIYSETFVLVGADEPQKEVKSAASKPWLNIAVPFMTSDSGNDICLRKDGTLCVVYVTKDAASVDQNVVNAMVDVKSAFVSKIERGITFSFMKLDASKEPGFASLFESTDYPYVVVMNPGKRKRYLRHEGKVDV